MCDDDGDDDDGDEGRVRDGPVDVYLIRVGDS